jgi:endonuclease YncB( thermonuclease family)
MSPGTKHAYKGERVIRFSVLSLVLAISNPASAIEPIRPQEPVEFDQTQGVRIVRGKVDRVSDGDTIAVRVAGMAAPMKVRMVGMDTAELHLVVGGKPQSQGWWAEAGHEHLLSMIPVGSNVKVEVFGQDSYGRSLGRVFDSQGRDVNLEMVRSGWGSFYVICAGSTCTSDFMTTQSVEEYAEACEDAVQNQRGIFDAQDPLPEQPFEYRMRMQNRRPERHVGDLQQQVLHAPVHYDRVPLCRRIFFGSEAEGIRLGYRRAHSQ